jgi:hypothetical protein
MLISLDFNFEAWIKNLRIEAPSKEEAINELLKMSLEDILSYSPAIDTEEITDIDAEVISYDAKVKVTDIEYDFDSDELNDSVIEYLKGLLPKELTVEIDGISDDYDIEDSVRDEIFIITKQDARTFKYQILEKK